MAAFNGFHRIALIVAVSACICACGTEDGPGNDRPAEVVFEPYVSDVDINTFTASSSIETTGGVVAVPGGASVSVPAGIVTSSAAMGLRESAAPTDATPDGTAVSSWYEGAVTHLELSASAEDGIVIEVPVQIPAEAIGHPGLKLWMYMGPDGQIPVSGSYDAVNGTFRATLLALPERFSFAVVFNPNTLRLDGSGLTGPIFAAQKHMIDRKAGWSSTDWVIDYDGQTVTAIQASKVLDAARRAAQAYSAAGFKDPVLKMTDDGKGPKWHIHLINGGSHFSGYSTQTDKGVVQRSGSLYVNTACIDTPIDENVRSVYAQVAHELFHAVFWGYNIPFVNYFYVSDKTKWAYRSSSGFNEGMATAVGTYIEQGSAITRPSSDPSLFNYPLGYFDSEARWQAYRNQDFFVFLLRVGTLTNVRTLMESMTLAPSPMSPSGWDIISQYGSAIEQGGLGLTGGYGPVSMTEILSEYMANRGFVRSWEGYIWPSEPNGGTPGESYKLDRRLFGDMVVSLDESDCLIDELSAECGMAVKMAPMTGLLVNVDVESLKSAFEFKPTIIAASATTTGGQVRYWLFAESAGKGNGAVFARGGNGSDAMIQGIDDATDAFRMIVTQGPADADVILEFKIMGEPDVPDQMGPECRELADCCPNLPSGNVIEECNGIVSQLDERNCEIAQASLLRLCRE